MSHLPNLPLLDGNRFIIISEGIDSSYGKNLIIAWLKVISIKHKDSSFKVLLFSHPKTYYNKIFNLLNLSNLQIIDNFGTDLSNDRIDLYEKLIIFLHQNLTSIFIFDCLSTLALQIGVAKMCKLIEKLNQNHRSQILCIYRRDFYINIPRLKTLGNVYINLKRCKKVASNSSIHYVASITHRKPAGGIVKWKELVHQNIENYSLIIEESINNKGIKPEVSSQPESAVKPRASFRIEMNKDEIKQRENLSLPYILPGNPGGQSKIIYVPDEVDDLDEEDPDDDLDI